MKITKTITEEITLPKYLKDNCHFWKIYSDIHCLTVTDGIDMYSIEINHATLPYDVNYHEESNKSEFDAAFIRVLTSLSLKA